MMIPHSAGITRAGTKLLYVFYFVVGVGGNAPVPYRRHLQDFPIWEERNGIRYLVQVLNVYTKEKLLECHTTSVESADFSS
eukprot:scaffold1388_cov267-Chaetoceros_neogracile.AAC.68